jgi:Asp-tRNA(Asn)/Glu-tRNA(Gln) amidotransferase A subunit family amidase
MGYTVNGQPKNLTFIAPPQQEQLLLELGAAFERLNKSRKPPVLFQ